jgi:hypothetical protein
MDAPHGILIELIAEFIRPAHPQGRTYKLETLC